MEDALAKEELIRVTMSDVKWKIKKAIRAIKGIEGDLGSLIKVVKVLDPTHCVIIADKQEWVPDIKPNLWRMLNELLTQCMGVRSHVDSRDSNSVLLVRGGAIVQRLVEVLPSKETISIDEVEIVVRRAHLGVGLGDHSSLLLAIDKAQRSIFLLEDVTLLEHSVDLALHASKIVEGLLGSQALGLHLLEAADLLGNLRLPLASLGLLLGDLGLGLPSLGRGLHQMARSTLGD